MFRVSRLGGAHDDHVVPARPGRLPVIAVMLATRRFCSRACGSRLTKTAVRTSTRSSSVGRATRPLPSGTGGTRRGRPDLEGARTGRVTDKTIKIGVATVGGLNEQVHRRRSRCQTERRATTRAQGVRRVHRRHQRARRSSRAARSFPCTRRRRSPIVPAPRARADGTRDHDQHEDETDGVRGDGSTFSSDTIGSTVDERELDRDRPSSSKTRAHHGIDAGADAVDHRFQRDRGGDACLTCRHRIRSRTDRDHAYELLRRATTRSATARRSRFSSPRPKFDCFSSSVKAVARCPA